MTRLAKCFLLLILFVAKGTSAHFQETIGYEFEDYNIQVLHRIAKDEIKLGPFFFLGFDVRPDHDDCEIRSIPLKISDIKDKFSLDLFKDVDSFYQNLKSDLLQNKMAVYERRGFFSSKEFQTFGSYPKLLSPWKSPKKNGDPFFDVGPQVTFSLDIRKVWNFLNRSFLFSYLDVYGRNSATMSVYAVDKKDKVYSEFVRSPKELAILKGFVALGLYYISDYLKNPGEKEEVSKFKHPLYMKLSFPAYYNLVLENLDKTKLAKLKDAVSSNIDDYVKARFRNESPLTRSLYEDFYKEVFQYWMDLQRKKLFTTKVFYDHSITSFSDFDSRIEPAWGPDNKNQYVYFELRNLRKLFAEQHFEEKKFKSQHEMYQQYAISEKEAILLVKDFSEKLIIFHGEQKED